MAYVGTVDDSEPLGKPFAASAGLHVVVAAVLVAGSLMNAGKASNWGDKESLGGAVGIQSTATVPMMTHSGEKNPVANDTQSQVPQAPPKPKTPPKAKEPEPDAIPIKSSKVPKKVAKAWQPVETNDRYRPYKEPKPNQLYSDAGKALVSPMMGKAGSGGVGLGSGSPLGDRFGAYAALLQQLLAQKWNTQDVDPRLHTAPPVVVDFRILRDGTLKDIRVTGSSGNLALDRSAERAVYDVGKVDPLPAGYEKNEATVQYSFVLSR